MSPSRDPNTKTIDSSQTLAAIGPIARSSVVDAVADRLRGEILAGRIPAGSKLPSERELSLALGVNRLTLRASLARLEALGLITTRHGAGTLVTSWRERASLDALATLMHSLTPEDPTWHELVTSTLEIRRILACENETAQGFTPPGPSPCAAPGARLPARPARSTLPLRDIRRPR